MTGIVSKLAGWDGAPTLNLARGLSLPGRAALARQLADAPGVPFQTVFRIGPLCIAFAVGYKPALDREEAGGGR